VLHTLGKVWAVLHGVGQESRDQARFLIHDYSEALEIGCGLLGGSTDRTKGAEHVLLAELGGVEPHLVDGPVMAEQ
jgi:hypothetical protein